MLIPWIKFIICVAVIIVSGIQVSRYGDMIAEKSGLGGTWIGVLLLASMTSLPELFTGISSVTLVNVPNLAVGTILGSNIFNLTIIAIMDLFSRNGAVLKTAKSNHSITAGFGVILLTFTGLALVLDHQTNLLTLFWINIISPLILIIYFIGLRIIFKLETQTVAVIEDEDLKYRYISKSRIYQIFALHAVIIIAVSIWLPFIGDEIATLTGWGNTFFGTVFIALATSLPEMVISLGALRIGAVDMAIGGVLGSNMFNLSILAVEDFFYTHNPIYKDVEITHLLPLFSAILMSVIIMCSLFYRPKLHSIGRFNWITVLFMGLFLMTVYLVMKNGLTA